MQNKIFKQSLLIIITTLGINQLCLAHTKHQTKAVTKAKLTKSEIIFINKMADNYHFSSPHLRHLLAKTKMLPMVIHKMNTPYEAKPWYVYKKLFVTDDRARAGAIYWLHHAKTLAKAQKIYGVPASIIVAIIGIETYYGEGQGNFPVLNTLTTLAFHYPSRVDFFQYELAQYLLLTREQKINPWHIKGSYAGAIGWPQFMPSSYRLYAVDFNHNHKRDLFHDTADVIGSVANFLKQAGWQRGQPIAVRAVAKNNQILKLLNGDLAPRYRLITIEHNGIKPLRHIDNIKYANILRLRAKNSYEYWVTLPNFYAITHYNTSPEYAMAATQLAAKIASNYYRS